jgi:hypothetical protein
MGIKDKVKKENYTTGNLHQLIRHPVFACINPRNHRPSFAD